MSSCGSKSENASQVQLVRLWKLTLPCLEHDHPCHILAHVLQLGNRQCPTDLPRLRSQSGYGVILLSRAAFVKVPLAVDKQA
jgi:hypothetical protein